MQNKPKSKAFFSPMYFQPKTCRLFTKYCALAKEQDDWDVILRCFIGPEENKIQFEIFPFPQYYMVFLPNSILANGFHFNKVSEFKKIVLNLPLKEEDFFQLVKELGGSVKKKPKKSPTLGDLMPDDLK